MTKLTRFEKLERARPAATEAAPAGPATSGRFAKLEPRHDAPQEPAADPFLPPPEREVILEVAPDSAPAADRARAENHARAEAALVAARELADAAQLERDQAQPDLATRTIDPLIRIANAHRWSLLGGGSLVIALLATAISPVLWILLPILLGVVVGSSLSARDA